jgi:hypothetical protein
VRAFEGFTNSFKASGGESEDFLFFCIKFVPDTSRCEERNMDKLRVIIPDIPAADHASTQRHWQGHCIQLDHVAEDDKDDGKSIVSA